MWLWLHLSVWPSLCRMMHVQSHHHNESGSKLWSRMQLTQVWSGNLKPPLHWEFTLKWSMRCLGSFHCGKRNKRNLTFSDETMPDTNYYSNSIFSIVRSIFQTHVWCSGWHCCLISKKGLSSNLPAGCSQWMSGSSSAPLQPWLMLTRMLHCAAVEREARSRPRRQEALNIWPHAHPPPQGW